MPSQLRGTLENKTPETSLVHGAAHLDSGTVTVLELGAALQGQDSTCAFARPYLCYLTYNSR